MDKNNNEDASNDPIGELSHEVFHNHRMREEREISDERYAEKRVQHLVYWSAGLIVTSLITILLKVLVGG